MEEMKSYARSSGYSLYEYLGGAVKKSIETTQKVLEKFEGPRVRVWGNFLNYELSLRCEGGESTSQLVADLYASPGYKGTPLFEGEEPLQQGAMLISQIIKSQTEVCLAPQPATSQHLDGLPLPAKFKWKRRMPDGTLQLIPEVTANVYSISADDVATSVIVEAVPEPNDTNCWGTAMGEIGPFDVDARSRQILDNGLASETLRFPVKLAEAGSNDFEILDPSKQLSIHIMAEELKIFQTGPMNHGYARKWGAKYGADFPRVDLHHNTSLRFAIRLSAEEGVELEALSRSQRDLIALAIRCFQARIFVTNTALIEQVLSPSGYGAGKAGSRAKEIDLCCLVQKLRAELVRTVERSEKAQRERDRAITEKESLQAEMTATIEAFQAQLSDAQPDGGNAYRSMMTEKSLKIQQLSEDLGECNTALDAAKRDLRELRSQIDSEGEVRTERRKGIDGTSLRGKSEDSENQSEISHLRHELRAAGVLLDEERREVKKLREVQESREVEQKKSVFEVENAFLHTKAKYDSLLASNKELKAELQGLKDKEVGRSQIDSNLARKNKDQEEEIQKLSHSLDEAVADRNRLSRLTESVTRELEKLRSTYNDLTSNLQAEAAKSLEVNKTQAEKIEQLEKNLRMMEGDRQKLVEMKATISDLQSELTSKNADLNKLKEECESLKNRIRKLAKSG